MYCYVILLWVVVLLAVSWLAKGGSIDNFEEEDDDQINAGTTTTLPPNIVFILVDDAGWNDFGYQSTDLAFTQPNIMHAAKEGIILSNYYSEPHCTPARAALMTGKYSVNVGMSADDIIDTSPYGLPLEYTTMANHLRDLGYQTHQIGKWNLGHFRQEYLPTARGFDTFVGYMGATLGSYTSRTISSTAWGAMKDIVNVWDWLEGDKDKAWAIGEDRAKERIYSTDLLTDLTIQKIQQSAEVEDKPFFIYLSYQATHSDVEAGVDDFEDIAGMETLSAPLRRVVAAQWISLDDSFKKIQLALTSAGVVNNTIVIMVSDNGGCPTLGTYVQPLRGIKTSLFEGGVKVPGFIWSPLITRRHGGGVGGNTYEHLFHVSDWLPTLYRAVGGDVTSLMAENNLDGVNQWDQLVGVQHVNTKGGFYSLKGGDSGGSSGGGGGGSLSPPRKEVLLFANQWMLSWDDEPKMITTSIAPGPFMAYRRGDYKLIMNSACLGYYLEGDGGSVSCMNSQSAHACGEHGTVDACASRDHNSLATNKFRCFAWPMLGKHYLFNIKEDPIEAHNLLGTSDEMRQIEKELAEKAWTILLQAPEPAFKFAGTEETKLIFNTWVREGGWVTPWEPVQSVLALGSGEDKKKVAGEL